MRVTVNRAQPRSVHSRDIDRGHRQATVEDRTAQAQMPDRPFETAREDGRGFAASRE